MRTPIFTLLLLICLCVGTAHAEVYSGTCGADGDNLTWELSSDYVLTISGTGAMAEYNWDSPWYDYKEMINSYDDLVAEAEFKYELAKEEEQLKYLEEKENK